MQFAIRNDVLVEREHHADEWRPVPVQRLQEAITAVRGQHRKRHSTHNSGKLGARIIRAGG